MGLSHRAPNLKYFSTEGDLGLRFRLLSNVMKLVEANISDVMGSLTSVKHLSLKLSPYKVDFKFFFFFLVLTE